MAFFWGIKSIRNRAEEIVAMQDKEAEVKELMKGLDDDNCTEAEWHNLCNAKQWLSSRIFNRKGELIDMVLFSVRSGRDEPGYEEKFIELAEKENYPACPFELKKPTGEKE